MILLAIWGPSCSLLMDDDKDQCASDDDCAALGEAICDRTRKVCIPSGSCSGSAAPPTRPTVTNAGETFTFDLAINTMDWGDGDDPPSHSTIGYDLDGLCTTARSGIACIPPPWAGGDAIDGPEGRDNGAGRQVASQQEFIGYSVISSAGIEENIRTGKALPIALLRVVGYAGKPDDDSLTVEWFDPSGLANGGAQPTWDGTDEWNVTPESVVDPASDPLTSSFVANAYVNDYTLVARFEGVVTVNFLEVPTQVHDAMMTAKLVQDPVSKRWRMDAGVITGRIETRILLGFIPELVRAFIGIPNFCMDDGQYADIKRLFCAFADLPGPDQAPTDVCEFISFGARATAVPVNIVGVAEKPTQDKACPPETDPINDSCAVE